MRKTQIVHGLKWPDKMPLWQIEQNCIRMGGVAAGRKGTGELFPHYLAFQKQVWPHHHYHRWSNLLLREFLKNQMTVVLGPKSSGKTHQAAKWGLTDYFCFPEQTGVMCTSTTVAALERRVWGEIKRLMKEAREVMGDLMPGHLIDHKHVVATDDIKEDKIRDLRNGIMGVAMKQGGIEAALANIVGFKNKRVLFIGDECQFMPQGFLECVSNLDGNQFFKACLLGNPVDPFDQLGKAAEPINGWTSLAEPEKTYGWRIRFKKARAINLVGTDSPNFDPPQTDPPRYPELVSKEKIDNVVSFWGKDSHQYYSQCKGVMKTGLMARRVVTRELCHQHKAFEPVEWRGTQRRRIAGLDVAYGGIGGDRCVYVEGEFGTAATGEQILFVHPPELVPVSIANDTLQPGTQIARWLKDKLKASNISVLDCFYDSTGRGSIGADFAKEFGYVIPIPVEFGGSPTSRPVREDLKIPDEKTNQPRHKRCDEHYRKFVTELWFSVRYAIEAEQIRGLTEEVASEGAMREWKEVAGNKIEIETKDETKERMGRSPDLFDALATMVEGCRQRGFKIQRLGSKVHVENDANRQLAQLRDAHYKRLQKRQLSYT